MAYYARTQCAECPHYAECPRMTRLFVNYCGPMVGEHAEKHRRAMDECMWRRHDARKTRILRREHIYQPQAWQPFQTRYVTAGYSSLKGGWE